MANQIEINDFINVLMEQRNSALNETDNQDNTA